MDDTGTVIDTDVIGQQRHALNTVKDRLLVVDVVEGLGGNHIGLTVDHNRGVIPAKLLAALGSQVLEHDLGTALVVQMIKSTGPSKFSRPAGLEVISKRTKMEGLVSSEYSISASASAVWQCLHQ